MKNLLLFIGMSVLISFFSYAYASDEDDLGKAEANYQAYCSPCHGQNGDGKGDLAAALSTPPRNHTDASIMSKRTDEQIFKAISLGGEAVGLAADMPAHNTIVSQGEIKGLVKLVRKLCKCEYKK